MMKKITTFLMFEDQAEEAMNFYTLLFDNAEITDITRYQANEAGREGMVKRATFKLEGDEYMCIDSPVKHDFTFTPAISLHVNCGSEAELEELFDRLSEGGEIFMTLDNYGFSQKFGWLQDRFGVSWQLNLP